MSDQERASLLSRITSDPEICGGKPCIRGMRMRVIDLLEMLAAHMSEAEILADFPFLEPDDVAAALLFAAQRSGYPKVAA